MVLKPELSQEILRSIAYSYAFKDIFKLFQALSLQLESEVSYNELVSLVGVDKNTVANYLLILEEERKK